MIYGPIDSGYGVYQLSINQLVASTAQRGPASFPSCCTLRMGAIPLAQGCLFEITVVKVRRRHWTGLCGCRVNYRRFTDAIDNPLQ